MPSTISQLLTYTSTITSASLRVRESQIIADLLVKQVNEEEWTEALFDRNVLQMKSPESIRRIGNLLRARLESLHPSVWRLVLDRDRQLATQAVFAGAIKNSRLLGDFMDITLREQRAMFAKKLEPRMWTDYVDGCRGRDPEMPAWSDSTIRKLRSAVFGMLAEAGYINNSRDLVLQTVFVDARLSACLRDLGESYVIRCMGVTE